MKRSGLNQARFAKAIDAMIAEGKSFVVATVVKTEGSSLGKPGFKVLISSSGDIVCGALGGACPESAIVYSAKETMQTGRPKTVKVFLEGVEDAVGVLSLERSRVIPLYVKAFGPLNANAEKARRETET